jgi:hypothetical protein
MIRELEFILAQVIIYLRLESLQSQGRIRLHYNKDELLIPAKMWQSAEQFYGMIQSLGEFKQLLRNKSKISPLVHRRYSKQARSRMKYTVQMAHVAENIPLIFYFNNRNVKRVRKEFQRIKRFETSLLMDITVRSSSYRSEVNVMKKIDWRSTYERRFAYQILTRKTI